MRDINKVSEITVEDVAEYIRLDDLTLGDQNEIKTFLNVARSYIQQFTGLTAAEVDTFPDMVICIFILCQDMYDNRVMYVDKTNVNKAVETILGMHSVNLL